MKKLVLSITLLCLAGIVYGQTPMYLNDGDVAPTINAASSGAFTHDTDGDNWRIMADCHGEWDAFLVDFPSPLDFSQSGTDPIVRLWMETRLGSDGNDTLFFQFALVDGNGRRTDTVWNFDVAQIELNPDLGVTLYEVDFTGFFDDDFGDAGNPLGPVDSTDIRQLIVNINPGWASQPVTGSLETYDYCMGNGTNDPDTIYVDRLEVGLQTTTGIAEDAVENSITVSPVPAKDYLNVIFTSVADAEVVLLDILGNVVATETASSGINEVQFTTSGLATGMYILSVATEDGTVTRKVVVE